MRVANLSDSKGQTDDSERRAAIHAEGVLALTESRSWEVRLPKMYSVELNSESDRDAGPSDLLAKSNRCGPNAEACCTASFGRLTGRPASQPHAGLPIGSLTPSRFSEFLADKKTAVLDTKAERHDGVREPAFSSPLKQLKESRRCMLLSPKLSPIPMGNPGELRATVTNSVTKLRGTEGNEINKFGVFRAIQGN
jgi:hypothetical protein